MNDCSIGYKYLKLFLGTNRDCFDIATWRYTRVLIINKQIGRSRADTVIISTYDHKIENTYSKRNIITIILHNLQLDIIINFNNPHSI